MATTAIWDVRGWLGKVVAYAENPEKTANPEWSAAERQSMLDVMEYTMEDAQERGLVDVLEYAAADYKTEQRYYVSGLNCNTGIARKQMLLTKRQWQKEGGIVAYHGYQSFKPGEATPELAHKIGVELARRLWGDRFEVVVATHLNTQCFHNHFVINSVSFLDGKRYYDNKKTYAAMRRTSDELCKAHGLSVILQENGRTKHYTEWAAEHAGERTWRSAIREDVDRAISASMTWQAFLHALRELGYDVKASGVKHVAVKPPGKERFVRLRSLGNEYAEETIRARILRQRQPTRPPPLTPVTVRRIRVQGDFQLSRVTWNSLRALYFFYRRKLKAAQRPQSPAPYALREDLRHLSAISEQAKFLYKYKLDTADDLANHHANNDGQIILLCIERKNRKNQLRQVGLTPEAKEVIAIEVISINQKLKKLRKEVRLCDDILIRSVKIRENMALAIQREKEKPIKVKDVLEWHRA